MKKLLVLLTVLLLPILTLAKEYESQDINIKLDINDEEYIVLTRDNLDNNDGLKQLNISKESMLELMNNSDIYLDIIKKDVSYEILVVVPNKTIDGWNNFSNATDKVLDDMREIFAQQVGATVSNVYKTSHNFVVVDYYDAKTGYYIVNYYTVVNAKGYNFQLQKKSEITEEEKSSLKKIVESVDIKVLDEYKNESAETQTRINNYGKTKNSFDYMRIVYGAIIGAIAGLISYVIGIFIRKKKSSV